MGVTTTHVCRLDRGLFFQVGRVLQRSFDKSRLGKVTLRLSGGVLWIESECGGGSIACSGNAKIIAELSATAFCRLITTRYREKSPRGEMTIRFNPSLGEISIDRAGVKANFLQAP